MMAYKILRVVLFLLVALSPTVSLAEGWQQRFHNYKNSHKQLHKLTKLGARGGFLSSDGPFYVRPWVKPPQSALLRHAISSSQLFVDSFTRPSLLEPSAPLMYGVIDGDLILPSARPLPIQFQSSMPEPSSISRRESPKPPVVPKLDASLFLAYFCNAATLSLPVVLLPVMAGDYAAITSVSATSFVAGIASIATLGGGFGKFCNGFVCQGLGGQQSSSLYLAGMSVCMLLLSSVPLGFSTSRILACLEFLASIQWTACAVVAANHYDQQPARLASAITLLSLASTSGVLFAKVAGGALLQIVPWRGVALCGAAMALTGSMIMRFVVDEFPAEQDLRLPRLQQPKIEWSQVQNGARSVLGSRLFWLTGMAQAAAFCARTSDRVLGSFFEDITGLSSQYSGALTACVTLGFVLGVARGNSYHDLPDEETKSSYLQSAYSGAVVSALGLAALSNRWLLDVLNPSQLLLTGALALLSAGVAACLAFQFYQIPSMVAKTFGTNRAVCLSFVDSLGFLFAAPVWGVTGQLVGRMGVDEGWSVAWIMLASIFAVGGLSMNKALLLLKQEEGLSP